jgi:hypothetical protein
VADWWLLLVARVLIRKQTKLLLQSHKQQG